jgi:hypothetical protein
VRYIINGTEEGTVNALPREHVDLVARTFLAFLGRDVEDQPGRFQVLPRSLIDRARTLTRDVKIDHDAPIEGTVTL